MKIRSLFRFVNCSQHTLNSGVLINSKHFHTHSKMHTHEQLRLTKLPKTELLKIMFRRKSGKVFLRREYFL